MRTVVRFVTLIAKTCWHVFAALCIVAGGLADGPGFIGVLGQSGLVAAVLFMVSSAMSLVTAEPLAFAALVIVVFLAADRLAPMVARWSQRLRL